MTVNGAQTHDSSGAIKLTFRRGTAAELTSANPTLAMGEPCFETDTGWLKIGDGSTAWTSLQYVSNSRGVAGSSGQLNAAAVYTTGNITSEGNVAIGVAGKGLKVKEGSNATMGVATLVTGTKDVATTAVKATSRILLTVQELGTVAAPKALAVTARVADTSFTITSEDATDTSVVAWMIVEPA